MYKMKRGGGHGTVSIAVDAQRHGRVVQGRGPAG